jgi:hypothetical protein
MDWQQSSENVCHWFAIQGTQLKTLHWWLHQQHVSQYNLDNSPHWYMHLQVSRQYSLQFLVYQSERSKKALATVKKRLLRFKQTIGSVILHWGLYGCVRDGKEKAIVEVISICHHVRNDSNKEVFPNMFKPKV